MGKDDIEVVASSVSSQDGSSGEKQKSIFKDYFKQFLASPKDTQTERRLSQRQAQLLAMGGCIGTAYFVTIGTALSAAGPAGLFISYTYWCSVVYATNCTLSEMTVYLPIDSSWIIYITRWVNESIGVANAWNYLFCEVSLVSFELTAFAGVTLPYWTTNYPDWLPITLVLVTYIGIQFVGVRLFGEVEFWVTILKVLLAFGMIIYAFITMVGGNPLHWVYGFTYWKNPGSFADYLGTGTGVSYLEGFLNSLIMASFTIAGPDYVSITAGEIGGNPRKTLKIVFKTVLVRLFIFFIVGSLAVAIICPFNADDLLHGDSKAAKSPYVISMKLLNIKGLPDLFNAILMTSIFSSGNGFFYCATRSLYGLAKEGKAPSFLTLCLKNGTPVFSVLVIGAFSCLSYLSLSNSSAVVLSWFVSLSTSSLMIYMLLINAAYIRFRQGLEAQNIPYESLPVQHRFSKIYAWYSMIMNFVLLWLQGYSVFKPGQWDVADFLFYYFMIFFTIFVAIVWQIYKRPRWLSPAEIDLTTGKAEIDFICDNYIEPEKTRLDRFLDILF